MKICKTCGAANDDRYIYCCYCGLELKEEVKCPHCGHISKDEAAFCGNCGRRMGHRDDRKLNAILGVCVVVLAIVILLQLKSFA